MQAPRHAANVVNSMKGGRGESASRYRIRSRQINWRNWSPTSRSQLKATWHSGVVTPDVSPMVFIVAGFVMHRIF
jgi:hypothetical protein